MEPGDEGTADDADAPADAIMGPPSAAVEHAPSAEVARDGEAEGCQPPPTAEARSSRGRNGKRQTGTFAAFFDDGGELEERLKADERARRRKAAAGEAAVAAAVAAAAEERAFMQAAADRAAALGLPPLDDASPEFVSPLSHAPGAVGGGGARGAGRRRARGRAREDEDEAAIAEACGFVPADDLCDEELEFLPPAARRHPRAYCPVRNHVLAKWRAAPGRPLSLENAGGAIRAQHLPLVAAAHAFLTRRGHINFGVGAAYAAETYVPGRGVGPAPLVGERPSRGSVVVVGAGLAGLAAARQLQAFGYTVAVVEARHRPGGRVHTVRLGSLTGPAVAVAELGGSVVTGCDGNPLACLATQLGVSPHAIRDKCPMYDGATGDEVDATLDAESTAMFNALLDTCARHREEFAGGAAGELLGLGTALEALAADSAVVADPARRSLFDFHMANLEYANASRLEGLSLAHWDQDDPYEMSGLHVVMPGGNLRLVAALAQGLPIFYGTPVASVAYTDRGVVVTARGGGRVFEADAAIVTLPLGCLKAGDVAFDPPLPESKLRAIKALGYGLLNKCVMLFASPFWDTAIDTFAVAPRSTKHRGEYFLFYQYAGVAGGAVLIGLVAGDAAAEFEFSPPAESLSRCLAVLRTVFGRRGISVPEPVDYSTTAWGSDEFSRGSYSSVAIGASGEDYEALATPLGRLFFAGEATTRKHPATMHGAVMTGLREAGAVDAHLNPPRRAPAPRARAPLTPAGWDDRRGEAGSEGDEGEDDGGGGDDRLSGAALAQALAVAFRSPAVEFGRFAAVWGPPPAVGVESTAGAGVQDALLRVDLARVRALGRARLVPIYLCLSVGDVEKLREARGGDEGRCELLGRKLGARLVGRRGLGARGRAVLSAVLDSRRDDPGGAEMAETPPVPPADAAAARRRLVEDAAIAMLALEPPPPPPRQRKPPRAGEGAPPLGVAAPPPLPRPGGFLSRRLASISAPVALVALGRPRTVAGGSLPKAGAAPSDSAPLRRPTDAAGDGGPSLFVPSGLGRTVGRPVVTPAAGSGGRGAPRSG